jgi:hypothetical protein
MVMQPTRRILALALLLPLWVGAQAIGEAELQRFEQIKARHDRGEPVSPDEQRFAQDIMARQRQAAAAQQNAAYAKAHPPRDFTGLVPLPSLGTGLYQGEQGGLYPGGRNTLPRAHLKAGLALARKTIPLDAEGRPSESGRIVFLSIGMSNTTQESQAFIRLAHADGGLNPKLVLVDGAQSGQTARITANPDANFWKVVDDRLSAAGVSANQVQTIWLKQANAGPTAPFPAETRKLQADLVATLHNLRDKFPNLKMGYLSSRIYAGYAVTPLNPEPHAYEGGFAVKWSIAAQIDGNPELNYDPSKGAVRSPWIAWGPYLWADGMRGRQQDSLIYTRQDLGPDGTHPSAQGQQKVGQLLLDFLKNDPTSRPWFVK